MVIPDSAMEAYEKALKSLWDGVCTVYGYVDIRDPVTNLTTQKEVARLENEPCRVCFRRAEVAAGDPVASVEQQIILLIDKTADIPPGSRIAVTQNGVATTYRHSGAEAVYIVHKEIALERWGEQA